MQGMGDENFLSFLSINQPMPCISDRALVFGLKGITPQPVFLLSNFIRIMPVICWVLYIAFSSGDGIVLC